MIIYFYDSQWNQQTVKNQFQEPITSLPKNNINIPTKNKNETTRENFVGRNMTLDLVLDVFCKCPS